MIGGALDAIIVLHNAITDTYHAAYFTEAPMPGPLVPIEKLDTVRLKSRMHHTAGAPTIDEARVHATALQVETELADANVLPDLVEWDGELGVVLLVPNWRKA